MAVDKIVLDSAEYVSANEESLFARDLDGQLIRLTESTQLDLTTPVNVVIDGEPVTVMKAVPLRNSQGIIQRNANGETVPRATTIYDAVTKRYGGANPVPVLCHREHMTPVGVCRVCMVEIQEVKASGRARTALVPSCTYQIKDGMAVTTLADRSEDKKRNESVGRIQSAVGLTLELLASENLSREEIDELRRSDSLESPNELKRLVKRHVNLNDNIGFEPSERHSQRGTDLSSELIAVNHDACILCQRCHRACNEIKENFVLGRNGKGYATSIAFDLNAPMVASSCVSCGECAISCPTDALTFHPTVIERQNAKLKEDIQRHRPSDRRVGSSESDRVTHKILSAEEMRDIPIFAGIPFKFLQFNAGACVRRFLKAGDILCEQGDYGATAFIMEKGRFEILEAKPDSASKKKAVVNGEPRGFFDFLRPKKASSSSAVPVALVTGSDTASSSDAAKPRLIRGVEDVILGEMACLNHYPRTRTVQAIEDAQVIEIGSNVLYMLQRNGTSRKILNDAYRRHALNSDLEKMPVFQGLSPEGRRDAARILAAGVELLSVEPGQAVFRQGEASDDFYLIRIGYVKVSRRIGAVEHVVGYLGPDGRNNQVGSFGEIAALSNIYSNELQSELEKLDNQPGVRTTTCSALDHVELVKIKSSDLKRIADENPEFRDQLIARARTFLGRDADQESSLSINKFEFVEQGLYNAQSLLVLDLESCTRCDECTKACADAHDGESRLIREGLRFENFLVATSCRSCTDPYCLVGCPVNAIFREGSKEIVIEDHCIGCGLCASNCPYGNITMYGHERDEPRIENGREIPVIQQKATTCDQCKSLDSTPRCVYACPHHAAFRMTGYELQEKIAARKSR